MSSKPFSFIACLLCLALPALAEKPNDNRSSGNDSRSSDLTQGSLRRIDKLGGKTLKQWVGDLNHRDPSVVSSALMVIPYFGQDAADYVPDVVKQLRAGDASPRIKAVIALRMIPMHETHRNLVIKELGRCLVSNYSQTIHRYEAVKTLQMLMTVSPFKDDERDAVIAGLVPNFGSPSTYELREVCIDALMAIGPNKNGPSASVTNALIQRVHWQSEPAEHVRVKAIMALGALGRPNDPQQYKIVLDVLRGADGAHSRDKIISMWAHVSLMALEEKVDDKELKKIAELLKPRKEDLASVRAHAYTALGALQEKSNAYVGDICDRILRAPREDDATALKAACAALGRIGNKGVNVERALIRCTEFDEPEKVEVVLGACLALAQLGFNDAEANKAIEKALEHHSIPEYQKSLFRKAIEEARKPRKQPAKEKDAPKNPERGIQKNK